jgi:hypothetical protein
MCIGQVTLACTWLHFFKFWVLTVTCKNLHVFDGCPHSSLARVTVFSMMVQFNRMKVSHLCNCAVFILSALCVSLTLPSGQYFGIFWL